jgi:outer membrane protein assembly factor BamB
VATDAPSSANRIDASAPPTQSSAVFRLAVAWVLTLVALPFVWGRVLMIGMMVGRPEPTYLGLLVGALVVVVVASYGVLGRFEPARQRIIALAIAATWLLTNGVLIWFFSGPVFPKGQLLLVYLPATLWVVWAAWTFSTPIPWAVRLAGLAALAAAALPFPLLITAGLTGNAQIDFAWRRGAFGQGTREAGRIDSSLASQPLALTETDHDYAQFLGPFRLGILPGARLNSDWAMNPPRMLWKKPVGEGWSAFAVVGDYAFTQEQRGSDECVVCYRVADGEPMWVRADPGRFDTSLGGPGPRATPTVTGGRVYAVGATGLLNCLDASTGRRVWAANIQEDNEADSISHGVCASPLVIDDRVLVCPTGSNGASLVAYDRETGKRRWRAGKDQASYGSPLVADVAGVRQVLLYTSAGVAAHDPGTGQLLWSFPWTNGEGINCSQPVPNAGTPDRVLLSTGYGTGCVLLHVSQAADGTWSAEPLWENRRLRTKFSTAVIHDGCAYGLDDGILTCLDLKTGRPFWKDGRYQHGQVLLAGNLLLVQAENGEVVLVEAARDRLRERGRIAALTGKTWNNPALAGRFLLVRNDHEAACYELPLAADSSAR